MEALYKTRELDFLLRKHVKYFTAGLATMATGNLPLQALQAATFLTVHRNKDLRAKGYPP